PRYREGSWIRRKLSAPHLSIVRAFRRNCKARRGISAGRPDPQDRVKRAGSVAPAPRANGTGRLPKFAPPRRLQKNPGTFPRQLVRGEVPRFAQLGRGSRPDQALRATLASTGTAKFV